MKVLCQDIIAFPESAAQAPERWVIMNVFARTAVGVGPEAFEVLASTGNEPEDSKVERFRGRTFRAWKIARFSHVDGLLADPSRFRRDASTWGEPEHLDYAGLAGLLRRECIVVDDTSAYRERFQPKRSLLDYQRFGNYHQQLGQELRMTQRRDAEEWWLEQKFTPDLQDIRKDNLYGAVQDKFLEFYLPQRLSPSHTVLDLGCGAGVIARKMAKTGAKVLGVDPNKDYIELARKHALENLRFDVRDIGTPGALDDLPAHGFDFVLMSDALLFYFIPYGPQQTADIGALIADLRRLLKPGGTFISLEPHPVFYLQPWLGDAERPFTFVTEYLNTQWRVNPPLARLAQPFLRQNFGIVAIEELRADSNDASVDRRAARFASEYPLWLLLELRLLE